MTKPKKPVMGIFSFTSCGGCQFEILDLEDELLGIFDSVDVAHFPMGKAENEEGPFDIAVVEGAITTPEEAKEIKQVRKRSGFLIAIGSCASYGGIPAIKDFYREEEIEVPVYKSTRAVKSIRADGINRYVKVDYFMHGCPPNKYEFLRVVKELLVGKTPKEPDYPVCKECREHKNQCLLQQGEPCMGPITVGGCDSVCTNHGIACKGCRGPVEDANIDPIVKIYKKMGYNNEDIKKFFISYAGTSRVFSRVVGKTCQLEEMKESKRTGKDDKPSATQKKSPKKKTSKNKSPEKKTPKKKKAGKEKSGRKKGKK
ncbi:MAG: oxidoreductase [Candidatus Woesearchaeota archaeon]